MVGVEAHRFPTPRSSGLRELLSYAGLIFCAVVLLALSVGWSCGRDSERKKIASSAPVVEVPEMSCTLEPMSNGAAIVAMCSPYDHGRPVEAFFNAERKELRMVFNASGTKKLTPAKVKP